MLKTISPIDRETLRHAKKHISPKFSHSPKTIKANMSSESIKKSLNMSKPSPQNSSKPVLENYCKTLEEKLKLAISAMEIHEKKIRELERENTKLIIKTQSAGTPTPATDISMNTSTASASPIANNADNLNEDFIAAANESPYSEYNKTKEDMTAPFEETNFAVLFRSKPMVFASHESPEKKNLHNAQHQNKMVISSEILHRHVMKSLTVVASPFMKGKKLIDVFEPLASPTFSYLKSFGIVLVSLYLISILVLCGEYMILPVVGKFVSITIDQVGFLLDINWMV